MKRRMIFCLFAAIMLVATSGSFMKWRKEPWTQNWKLITTWGEGGLPSSDFGGNWCAGEMTPGKYANRPNYGGETKRTGILGLHPLSALEPAKLAFSGVIPHDKPVLVVTAGGNVNGDCLLQCRVGDEIVKEYVLNGSQWTTCEFDLSPYLKQPASVQLWNVAGGSHPWHFEHCYIDSIEFAPKR